MIPRNFVLEWQGQVAWQTLAMIEQDLIISRALVCLYTDPVIREKLVFRGGTAFNKLFLNPAARYSEDIDFVQRYAEPIGKTIDAIRGVLSSWLGEPKRKITKRGVKLYYSYVSIADRVSKLKIEINTTEHLQIMPLLYKPYGVSSQWFTGDCVVTTYRLEELMATKLRALYQRRKGRDLFDLWLFLTAKLIDVDTLIEIFKAYCAHEGICVSKQLFKENLENKLLSNDFQSDMRALLPQKVEWDINEAYKLVCEKIMKRLL